LASFVVEDYFGYFGLAILLFIIVYFLLRILTHRDR
jgi:hypothetical protein